MSRASRFLSRVLFRNLTRFSLGTFVVLCGVVGALCGLGWRYYGQFVLRHRASLQIEYEAQAVGAKVGWSTMFDSTSPAIWLVPKSQRSAVGSVSFPWEWRPRGESPPIIRVHGKLKSLVEAMEQGRISSLTLSGTDLDDSDLEGFSGKDLSYLMAINTNLSGGFLKEGTFSKLHSVSLGCSRQTSLFLENAGDRLAIEKLWLVEVPLDQRTVDALSQQRHLTQLEMVACDIVEAVNWSKFGKLPLTSIVIAVGATADERFREIPDQVIQQLGAMPSLKNISLSGEFSESALQKLREERPDLKIDASRYENRPPRQ